MGLRSGLDIVGRLDEAGPSALDGCLIMEPWGVASGRYDGGPLVIRRWGGGGCAFGREIGLAEMLNEEISACGRGDRGWR